MYVKPARLVKPRFAACVGRRMRQAFLRRVSAMTRWYVKMSFVI
jgi:hypothetical protein